LREGRSFAGAIPGSDLEELQAAVAARNAAEFVMVLEKGIPPPGGQAGTGRHGTGAEALLFLNN